MIPILSPLLLMVADTRNEIAALSSALVALDTHTRTLPSTSQIQGAVQAGATVPLSSSLRGLSHTVAGAVPTHTTMAPSTHTARPAHVPPPKRAQPPRPQPPQTNKPKQGMDPDVPRYDPSSKTF